MMTKPYTLLLTLIDSDKFRSRFLASPSDFSSYNDCNVGMQEAFLEATSQSHGGQTWRDKILNFYSRKSYYRRCNSPLKVRPCPKS